MGDGYRHKARGDGRTPDSDTGKRTPDSDTGDEPLDNEELQAIFHSVSDAIFVHDGETGEIIDVNETMCEMYGYSREEARQLTVEDLSSGEEPYTQERAAEKLQRAAEGDQQVFEWHARDSDDELFWVEVSMRRADVSDQPLILVTVREIGGRIERKRKLRQTKERLQLALEGTDTGVWEWDLRTDESEWTEQMERLFGFEPGGFPGTYEAFIERVHPEDVDAVESAQRRALEIGDYRAEFRVHVDGETIRWVDARATVSYEDDDPVRMVGIVTDVTERKERERQLEETKRQLEASNEQLEKFVGTVSHDLRNPLNVLLGNAKMARQTNDADYLDEIVEAGERMDDIIADLLELARAGRTVGDPEPVPLATVVDDAWGDVDTGRATLELSLSETAMVEAYYNRLLNLFENLFRNAVEHNDPPLTIRIGLLTDSESDDSDTVHGFFVEDDGAGIPDEERDEVFEHGFTTSQNGTGFGLSIVSDIVEAHGWEIDVRESQAGGARFEIATDSMTDRSTGE